jgi:ArsR family transcriptional regulator, arsenate/arsenite/antimonite-responsive transcriptional repressor
MKDDAEKQVVTTLGALAQGTRLAILRLVARSGDDGIAAGEIARATATPPSTLSFHLKELAQAGVLKARPQGRFIYYALEDSALVAAVDFLQSCLKRPKALPPVSPVKPAHRSGRKPKRGTDSTDGQLNIFEE